MLRASRCHQQSFHSAHHSPPSCALPPLFSQPYRITLDRAASGAIFHQCVYVLCATDAATMQASGGQVAGSRQAWQGPPLRR